MVVWTYDTTAPTITLVAPSTWGQTNLVTANISDGQSGVADQKWALGKDLPASYFNKNGNSFTGGSFSVSQNGIYTVYAKYNDGNEAVQTVTVNYVYKPAPMGNYTQSFTDMSVTSPGINATFERIYNSADNIIGPFGRGWTFSYEGRKSISYDTNGNMTSFNGWTYSWNGKNLASSTDGINNIAYQYNSDGIRTQKTVNGTITTYTLDENNNITSETNGTDTINYARDINGNLLGMTIDGNKYSYEFNVQGDIIGLIDNSNNEVVTYRYDSWGKLLNIGGSLASTVGTENPFRYKGYYYDSETGLYYLQSRYYNLEIGRFISKDDLSYHDGETGISANLYAYANNNPVMNSDPTGHFIQYAIQIGLGALTSLASYLISTFITYNILHIGSSITFWGTFWAFSTGLVSGLLSATTMYKIVLAISQAIVASVGCIIGAGSITKGVILTALCTGIVTFVLTMASSTFFGKNVATLSSRLGRKLTSGEISVAINGLKYYFSQVGGQYLNSISSWL